MPVHGHWSHITIVIQLNLSVYLLCWINSLQQTLSHNKYINVVAYLSYKAQNKRNLDSQPSGTHRIFDKFQAYWLLLLNCSLSSGHKLLSICHCVFTTRLHHCWISATSHILAEILWHCSKTSIYKHRCKNSPIENSPLSLLWLFVVSRDSKYSTKYQCINNNNNIYSCSHRTQIK